MAHVAVLGMGLLGIGFAENLLNKGQQVRVWNRTIAKCDSIRPLGAEVAETPAEAVRGASRVHLILSEDHVVDVVIEALLEGLEAGCPIIDHSTNAPKKVGERVERLAAAGVSYLHAPVFMAPANSRNATGMMLVGGDQELVAKVLPMLEAMTGTVRNVGPEPTRAATVKLTGNAMLIVITAGMGDVFQIGTNNGMTPEECLELFEVFSPTAVGMGRRVLATGPAGFELTMARKDVRLMTEAAGGSEHLFSLPGIAAGMDEAIRDGRGSDDFTHYVQPKKIL